MADPFDFCIDQFQTLFGIGMGGQPFANNRQLLLQAAPKGIIQGIVFQTPFQVILLGL